MISFGNAESRTKLSLPELATFAREHGLSLIVDDDVPEKNLAGFSIRLRPERAMAFPFRADTFSWADLAGSYRGFGIMSSTYALGIVARIQRPDQPQKSETEIRVTKPMLFRIEEAAPGSLPADLGFDFVFCEGQPGAEIINRPPNSP